MGAVQYRLGWYGDALSSLLHAGELRMQQSISNHAFLAMTYHALGRTSEARSAFQQAASLLERPETMQDPRLAALVQEARSAVEAAHRELYPSLHAAFAPPCVAFSVP